MSRKFFAVRWPNGKKEVVYDSWAAVKKTVSGVSRIQYKGFANTAEAEKWLAATKPIPFGQTSDISKGEWMAKNINTPKWRARRAERELDNGFRRGFQNDRA